MKRVGRVGVLFIRSMHILKKGIIRLHSHPRSHTGGYPGGFDRVATWMATGVATQSYFSFFEDMSMVTLRHKLRAETSF